MARKVAAVVCFVLAIFFLKQGVDTLAQPMPVELAARPGSEMPYYVGAFVPSFVALLLGAVLLKPGSDDSQ
jgi:hypothetical protein